MYVYIWHMHAMETNIYISIFINYISTKQWTYILKNYIYIIYIYIYVNAYFVLYIFIMKMKIIQTHKTILLS